MKHYNSKYKEMWNLVSPIHISSKFSMEMAEVNVVAVPEENRQTYLETDNDRLVMAIIWLIMPVSISKMYQTPH